MNYTALMLGAFGVAAVVTVYYTLIRKGKPEATPEPSEKG